MAPSTLACASSSSAPHLMAGDPAPALVMGAQVARATRPLCCGPCGPNCRPQALPWGEGSWGGNLGTFHLRSDPSVLTQLKLLPGSASPSLGRALLPHSQEGRWQEASAACSQSPQIQAAGPTPTLAAIGSQEAKPDSLSPPTATQPANKELQETPGGPGSWQETLCPGEERVFRISEVSEELGRGAAA